MTAIWGIDYDFRSDKCYKVPSCPECEEPIARYEDGQYHCLNCGEIVELSDDMLSWFKVREETKIEIQDCPKMTTKSGVHLSGCGGKNCMEIHYRRNPVTLKWEQAFGFCKECGTRFIV